MKETIDADLVGMAVCQIIETIVNKMNDLGDKHYADFSFNVSVYTMSLALSIMKKCIERNANDVEQEKYIKKIVDQALNRKNPFQILDTN